MHYDVWAWDVHRKYACRFKWAGTIFSRFSRSISSMLFEYTICMMRSNVPTQSQTPSRTKSASKSFKMKGTKMARQYVCDAFWFKFFFSVFNNEVLFFLLMKPYSKSRIRAVKSSRDTIFFSDGRSTWLSFVRDAWEWCATYINWDTYRYTTN